MVLAMLLLYPVVSVVKCDAAIVVIAGNLDSASFDEPLRKRKLLVLINPASGPGKSEKLFRNKVQPLFEVADIELDIVITGKNKQYKSY